MYVCMYECMHVIMYVRMYVFISECMYTCMYVSTHALQCMYILCVCMYAYVQYISRFIV